MHFTCSKSVAKASGPTPHDPIPGWKRATDIVCVLVALPVLALATLIMTVVIKLTSPGSVFFRQERVGYGGRRFKCYKFRTMHDGADTKIHQDHCEQLIRSNVPMVKMDSRRDSRLIPGGWLLRASGLDELPQLLNVLQGDMSLIGPRPCVPYEYDQYLPWQRERFGTLPGLTGLWQVSGKNRTTFDEMIRLDIHYAQHKSPWMDFMIVVMTLPALFQQISDTRKARKLPSPPAPPRKPGVSMSRSRAPIGTGTGG
jgi:lipopolysaccharide/colanic/teichoic acid biosynthesis glycosyltransferase